MKDREERRRAFEAKLAGLRDAYVRRLPKRIAELTTLAESGEYERVAQMAHAIRGSGGSYGLTVLVTLTEALEEACIDPPDVEEIGRGLSELVDAAQQLLDELDG